ncbi:MAG: Bax inhibitor-1/YccA family protein [Lentisphaeria bacterium]|nr:Bax inhibitor-1/YccA family protein [Lentisphaeria bacterium]
MYDNTSYDVNAQSSSRKLALCIANVYWWMTFALLITAVTAYMVGTSRELLKIFVLNRGVFFFLALIELGLVFWISAGIRKMSASTATALFVLYAAVNGLTLSAIFAAYSMKALAVTFAVTAGTFGGTALVGTVIKKDLSRFGGILLMALIGLVIASLVNMFWTNSTLERICTYAGVLIFVGLTAYDAQKIRLMYQEIDSSDSESVRKVAVLGALSLYLDFINLFLYLLRIFGRRD